VHTNYDIQYSYGMEYRLSRHGSMSSIDRHLILVMS